jgi:oxaloacetate decarboxylase beta subunit
MEKLELLWQSTSLAHFELGQVIMMSVGALLLYLAIVKKFEPLLLLPIGFGAVLTNIPLAGFSDPGGLLYLVYHIGIDTGVFPLLIFMGVGAMTDFSALIANPRMLLLGAAAQFGIFGTLFGAIALNMVPGFEFSLQDAAAIAIIGGADGPTAIFLASKLAPDLLGAIAVAAYSTPLVGMFCLGNLMKESGVVDRLSNSAQNELINVVTIFLGLAVGSKLSADKFLTVETLGILALGAIAFSIGTAAGILMAKVMSRLSSQKINPLIGAAGVSAVPMAARVVNKVGLEANHHNFLLMHAMGPNVAGVLGSAVAAGILLALVG